MSWIVIKRLKEERGQLVADAKAILDKSEAENRDLTPDEVKRFDDLHAQADAKKTELDRHERSQAVETEIALRNANLGRITQAGQPVAGDVRNGEAFGPEKRMSDVVKDERFASLSRPLSIGRFIKGLATGDWQGAEDEQRAMTLGVQANGGFLVPTPLSTSIIDLARNQSRVFQAGAMTVPMTASTLKMVRVASDGGVGWRAENAAFTSSDMTFEGLTFTAKTLGGIAKMSIELAEDAANIDQTVTNSLAAAIALELDRAALRGSGSSNQPQGIRGATGVQTIAAVGDLASYAPFSQAVQKVREANGEPNAAIFAPRTAGDLDRLADTTGQPLQPPPSFRGIAQLVTNQIPTNLGAGTDESEAYVGDFKQLLIGVRTQLVIEVSRTAADSSSSAMGNGQVWIRAYMRGDVQIARPTHFVYLSGITTP